MLLFPLIYRGRPSKWGIERQLISESGRGVHHSYGYFKSNQQNVRSRVTREIHLARYYQARRREKQMCQQGYGTEWFLQDKKEQSLEDLALPEWQLGEPAVIYLRGKRQADPPPLRDQLLDYKHTISFWSKMLFPPLHVCFWHPFY